MWRVHSPFGRGTRVTPALLGSRKEHVWVLCCCEFQVDQSLSTAVGGLRPMGRGPLAPSCHASSAAPQRPGWRWFVWLGRGGRSTKGTVPRCPGSLPAAPTTCRSGIFQHLGWPFPPGHPWPSSLPDPAWSGPWVPWARPRLLVLSSMACVGPGQPIPAAGSSLMGRRKCPAIPRLEPQQGTAVCLARTGCSAGACLCFLLGWPHREGLQGPAWEQSRAQQCKECQQGLPLPRARSWHLQLALGPSGGSRAAP